MNKVIIMGAGGRDFYLFQRLFKDRSDYRHTRVVAFTAAQIPGIENRVYPPRLSGGNYPAGIPIHPASELKNLIGEAKKDGSKVYVFFAYSDESQDSIARQKKLVEMADAKFIFKEEVFTRLMLSSLKPLIAVTAVRTGCGKSSVTRYIARVLKEKGLNPIIVRHPMPYGDLNNPANDVQRFSSLDDSDRYGCTFEEREEYEPIINAGFTVYAGIDYEKILKTAEKEADVVIWDGGNNDTPFFKPDLWITVLDPHRAGDELAYPHGFWNLRNADIILVNKISTVSSSSIEQVLQSAVKYKKSNDTPVLKSDLKIIPVSFEDEEKIRGKRVIAVEDGPTVTHGGMSYGAAKMAAAKYECELVDPYPYLQGTLIDIFEKKYPHLKEAKLLPNIGYSRQEITDLQDTINIMPIKAVLCGTPIDLARVLMVAPPIVPVSYELVFVDGGEINFDKIIKEVRK